MLKSKKRLLAVALAVSAFGLSGCSFFGSATEPEEPQAPANVATEKPSEPEKTNKKIPTTGMDEKTSLFVDDNGICGVAKNSSTGEHIAIAKGESGCPKDSELKESGFEYTMTADEYRPTPSRDETLGESCGTARYDSSSMVSQTDLDIIASQFGDLSALLVAPSNGKCPTMAELGDIISSSAGTPVRFHYNNFDVNPNGYPVMSFQGHKLQKIDMEPYGGGSLLTMYDASGKYKDANGRKIPMFFVNPEAQAMCGEDLSKCYYKPDLVALEKVGSNEEYMAKSHNDFLIPQKFMTKDALDVCGGYFKNCDIYTREDGTDALINIKTKKEYILPENVNVESIEEVVSSLLGYLPEGLGGEYSENGEVVEIQLEE